MTEEIWVCDYANDLVLCHNEYDAGNIAEGGRIITRGEANLLFSTSSAYLYRSNAYPIACVDGNISLGHSPFIVINNVDDLDKFAHLVDLYENEPTPHMVNVPATRTVTAVDFVNTKGLFSFFQHGDGACFCFSDEEHLFRFRLCL